MNNASILALIQYIANKEQTGNTVSPTEFTSILQVATLKHLKRKIGLPEEYRVGMPVPRQQFEATKKLTDDISQLKVWMGSPDLMPLQIDSDGIATIPTDFYYPSSLSYKHAENVDCEPVIKKRVIEVLTDAQWDEILNHSIRPPSYKYPVCNFQNGFIRFAPTDLKFADFVYIRFPLIPVYDYYFDSNGAYVYLPQGSTHTLLAGEEGSQGQTTGTVVSLSQEVEFDDTNKIDIAGLILQMIGINLREGQLFQYADKVTQQGV